MTNITTKVLLDRTRDAYVSDEVRLRPIAIRIAFDILAIALTKAANGTKFRRSRTNLSFRSVNLGDCFIDGIAFLDFVLARMHEFTSGHALHKYSRLD